VISNEEWYDFSGLFLKTFIECDKDSNFMLNITEFEPCLTSDSKFSKMLEFNNKIATFNISLILSAFDLDMDGQLNFYDYLMLRNFNNAYDICLVKEGKFYFKNFPVAMHIVLKNL
jgi:hypothetical protein